MALDGGGGGELVYVTDVAYSGEYVGTQWCAQIQVMGRRRDGRSVVVRVRGMRSYFYCNRVARAAPPGSAEERCFALEDAQCLQESLERFLAHAATETDDRASAMAEAWRIRSARTRASNIRATAVSVACTRRIPIMTYQVERDLFRVETTHPHVIAMLRDAVLRGQIVPHLTCDEEKGAAQAYEANVEFVLRFMIDTGVRCHGWVRVSEEAKETSQHGSSYCTSPDLVCESPGMLRVVSDDEESALRLVPSLRLLSFDIECAAPPGTFPDPARDPVIQIACDWTTLDGRLNAEVERTARATLLALHDTDATVVAKDGADTAVETRCFESEEHLLCAFAELVRTEDPDVITSWNGPNFDWKYIVARAAALRLPAAATMFSRLHRVQTRNRLIAKTTKAHGHQEINQVDIPGRFVFDMMEAIQPNYKLRSYKLNDVAHLFLNERKDDVDHTEITGMWRSTPQTRGTLGRYCVQDARLPRRLLLHTVLLLQYLEMARVCCVPTSYLTTKGQSIKVSAQILNDARGTGFVVPFTPRTPEQQHGGGGGKTDTANTLRQEASYVGATVLEPDRGFYTTPVAALDFAAMYPSIMRELNLSHDTYIPGRLLPSAARAAAEAAGRAPPAWALLLTDDDCVVTQSGEIFVKSSVREGVLPRILNTLLAARRAARAKIRTLGAGEEHIAAALDKRQLALKVSANSVYGFTGAERGPLPCLAIATTVTARGRDMIETTTRVVGEYYAREFAPTYGGSARVIYGDTDSVLVVFPCSVPFLSDGKLADVSAAVAESFMFAVACSKAAAAVFPAPHDLEVEKAYLPYLLVSKKRYAGGLFTYDRERPPGNAPEKISASGIETVRRDNANMIPRQLQAVLDALMFDLAPERAIAYAQDAAYAIIHGPVPAVAIAEGCARAACAVLAPSAERDARFHAAFLPVAIAALGRSEAKDGVDVVGDGVLQLTPHGAEKEWQAAARAALLLLAEECDVPAAAAVVADAVAHTLRLNVTFDDHIISEKYARNVEDYAGKMAFVSMMQRMEKRGAEKNADGTPKDVYAGQFKQFLGSRVNFIVAGPSPLYKSELISDRAEDPVWAQMHGVLPDPVHYLGQLLRPLSRILKPLVGTRQAAYRRIMMYARNSPRPDRGFVKTRFDAKICTFIWGSYASGALKRIDTPVAAERKAVRKAETKYKKAAKAALARGAPPPPKPPAKRPRRTGPLDAFFSPVVVVASAAARVGDAP